METILEETKDGSHTLFIPQLNEHYHSVNGAIQESLHVFIETGLRQCQKERIRVFEVGFGTGLNAFLTFLYARESSKQIDYTSIELYPLSGNIVDKLNYPELLSVSDKAVFEAMHQCAWNKPTAVSNSFQLTKIESDLISWKNSNDEDFDIVYFDAFAPDKQPEMWSQEIFDNLYQMMSQNAIFVTYCAKGMVRRMLQTSGFEVERLPGPPGKREMLRAVKK